MSFSVEPKALRDMAHTMRDVAFDVVYPWQYTDQYLALSGDGELFELAKTFNDDVLAKLDDTFEKLMKVTGACPDRLEAVAHYYESTDHAVEARMDKKIDRLGSYADGPYPDAPGDPTDTAPEED